MTLAEYGSIAEIIGVLGMIASLIYVGYQLQQARVQLRGRSAVQNGCDNQLVEGPIRFRLSRVIYVSKV